MEATNENTVKAIPAGKKNRLPAALWALALCVFGFGTGESVVAGLLLKIATNLNVPTSSAGLLVSGYAIGVVVGALLVPALTRRLARKTALLLLMGWFVSGNLLSALAPGYAMLISARVITGLSHAAFFGLGSIIAAELVTPDKRASAIAIMFTGLTLAYVLGLPLGTVIGQAFGWRFTFLAVTLLGVLAILGILALVPRLPQEHTVSIRQELSVVRRPQVLLGFAMTAFGNGSVVTVLTYIAPILVTNAGFPERAVGPILLLFGIGFVVGNAAGGKLADWRLMPSLLGILAVLAVVLAGFAFTSHYKIATLLTVFLLGTAAFGIVPGLQLRVVDKSKGAPKLASAFNIAAFNLGSAGGAYLGGVVIDSGLGLNAVPWVGALVAVVAISVTTFSWSLDLRTRLPVPTAPA
jgi:MFS transporter, DHA1 family, inner membrane transport protein